MTLHADDLKNELKKSLALVQGLKDEIALKMHLAGMDAKARWTELEAHLKDVERSAASAATETTKSAVAGAIEKLKKFHASLDGK